MKKCFLGKRFCASYPEYLAFITIKIKHDFYPISCQVFLYPLKTSDNQRFSDIFRGYKKRPVAKNGLNSCPHVFYRIYAWPCKFTKNRAPL